METQKKKFLFEEEVCSRCLGSGKYSWCYTHGDKCFKCGGTGVVLTKRGEAAQSYFHKLCTKKLKDVKVGDVVQVSGMTNGGGIYTYFAKVVEVKPSDMKSWSMDASGVYRENGPRITIGTSHPKYGESGLVSFEDHEIRYRDETYEDKKKQALEYQSTLTKQGKPRKRANGKEINGN